MDTMYSESAQLIRSTEAAGGAVTADDAAPAGGVPARRPFAGRRGPAPRRSARRRAIAAVAAACSMGAALLVSGCGQNFEQEGGVVPVPHASTEGVRTVTPVPVPSEKIIGPGYAPPRAERPTQTAVPNLPGGKA